MPAESLLPQDNGSAAVKMGSKTWRLDTERGRLGEMIDGEEAVKQAILVALSVPRYQHLIFSDNFGEEVTALLGRDYDYFCAAAPALIRSALLPDDRIKALENFRFARCSDGVEAFFTVILNSGASYQDSVRLSQNKEGENEHSRS